MNSDTCPHERVGIIGHECLYDPDSGEYFWDCLQCGHRSATFKTSDEATEAWDTARRTKLAVLALANVAGRLEPPA
jgi:hypothetical protein